MDRRADGAAAPGGGCYAPPPGPVPVAAAPVVPVDFKVVKRRLRGGGKMEVRDASGGLAFRFVAAAAGGRGRALLDAAGVVLVTVRSGEVMGEWQAFRGNSLDFKDIIYTAKLISVCSNRKEVHVFMPPISDFQDAKPSYRLIGNTSRRACTVISGESIVSQTNLLYKLKKVFYSTRKFRVTIYPGNDTVLIMAMIVYVLNMDASLFCHSSNSLAEPSDVYIKDKEICIQVLDNDNDIGLKLLAKATMATVH